MVWRKFKISVLRIREILARFLVVDRRRAEIYREQAQTRLLGKCRNIDVLDFKTVRKNLYSEWLLCRTEVSNILSVRWRMWRTRTLPVRKYLYTWWNSIKAFTFLLHFRRYDRRMFCYCQFYFLPQVGSNVQLNWNWDRECTCVDRIFHSYFR